MSYQEQYKGYDWIKVEAFEIIEVNGENFVSEAHHIDETEFLIAEIRKLAELLDCKEAALKRHRRTTSRYESVISQMERTDHDYLPYEDRE